VIVSSYSCIDASTGEYQEEEGFYPEEEENFDHLNNQGKLTPLQALWLQANILAKCHALWGKAPLVLPFLPQAYPKFLPYKFLLVYSKSYFYS
jgi:hypothetical protein